MGYITDLRDELKDRKRALIMSSAGVIIKNTEGEILLQQRTDNNKWGLPGGSMELGETFQETAKREVLEEVGIKINNMSLFNVYSGEECHYIYPNGDEIYNAAVIFLCSDYEGNIVLDGDESKDAKFFSVDDIPELEEINPPDRIIIKNIKNTL